MVERQKLGKEGLGYLHRSCGCHSHYRYCGRCSGFEE